MVVYALNGRIQRLRLDSNGGCSDSHGTTRVGRSHGWSSFSRNLRQTILVGFLIDLIALILIITIQNNSLIQLGSFSAAIVGTLYTLGARNRATVPLLLYTAATAGVVVAIVPYILSVS